MKILYISEGGNTCDYQRDMLFHGLRSLLGPDVVDVHKIETMYQGYPTETCYGKGFTLYGLLPDIPVDRTDIFSKIRRHFFDLVIYGSVRRNVNYLHEVLACYRPHEIIQIDGEDDSSLVEPPNGCVMFKRELLNPERGFLPIHFAIPNEKILSSVPKKWKLLAPMDPENRASYIYATEPDYYLQYGMSYYGITGKKAGWDCLRHYEILSQWCMPYFRNFENMPDLVCQHLLRPEFQLAKDTWEYFGYGLHASIDKSAQIVMRVWEALIEPCMVALGEHCTTEALAKYVLDTVTSHDEPRRALVENKAA